MRHRSSALLAFLGMAALFGLAACSAVPRAGVSPVEPVVVPEAFVTPRDASDNVDSPAVWHGPEGQHWVIVSAKATDHLLVFDAATGAPVRRVEGTAAFERPNGVAVVDDLVFVVERDGARVRALRLPGFEPLGAFGGDVLEKPYGITVVPLGGGRYGLYVTDNDLGFLGFLGIAPPDRALSRRIHRFAVTPSADALTASHEGTIGETGGPGVVHIAESILADPAHERLFVAEEKPGRSAVKVYRLGGGYTGQDLPASLFPNQAEGLALAPCDDGTGYVVATDQAPSRSYFHVFDRATLAYRGTFAGRTTANTDGVALTLVPFGPFPRGAFFAVDDDAATAAFDWGAVLNALGLPGCGR